MYSSKNEVINDGGVKKLVTEQMTQWSEMIERHRREKWALQKQQATEQQDALVKLMESLQAAQMKQLEIRHEKYGLYIIKSWFKPMLKKKKLKKLFVLL